MNENEKIARECAEEISRMDGVTGLLREQFAALVLSAITRATEGLQKENEQLVQLLRKRGIHVEECDFLLLTDPATKDVKADIQTTHERPSHE